MLKEKILTFSTLLKTRILKSQSNENSNESQAQRKNSISELINNEKEILNVCDLNEENLNNLKRIRKYLFFI